jgi:phosphate:Na+ symporter
MDIFDGLTLIGGLCLFLFGMNLMGQALERRAGSGLRSLLGKLTQNKAAGFLTGLAVTAVIQSSSATTVMVVGFVNSAVMTLRQAINVIMGANVGTTVTAWILSLSGIDSSNVFVQLLKPTSFTPILALIGTIYYMFGKTSNKKDTGVILLGFATLMFGMDTMSDAVAGLADVPQFKNMFLMFKNPILGVLAGAFLTAAIQSSSASVGILQALAVTGQVSFGAAIPIIMGQNIGTCVTALLSSVGTNKNARRAAIVHLLFNIIGTLVWVVVFWIIKATLAPAILDAPATLFGIAVAHSAFNILCTALMLPLSGFLEKLVIRIVPDNDKADKFIKLDERLLETPPMALARSNDVAIDMAKLSVKTLKDSLKLLEAYDKEAAEEIYHQETKTDKYEDMLSTYLVKLSSYQVSDADNAEAAKLLRLIGEFERIADHSINIAESAEELASKNIAFSAAAKKELKVMTDAVTEILDLTLKSFTENNLETVKEVEPLEEVIDGLKAQLKKSHIDRLQNNECTIEAGFVWADLLTNLERTADNCSNIAVCIVDVANHNMNAHKALREMRENNYDFSNRYEVYLEKYAIK